MYRPNANFNVPMKLMIPEWRNALGVDKKAYPAPDDISDDLIFYGNFRTFGGTEKMINDVYSVENTAVIDTWYRPEITAECRILLLTTGDIYEIIGVPENIEMRNQFMKFKVKYVGGET